MRMEYPSSWSKIGEFLIASFTWVSTDVRGFRFSCIHAIFIAGLLAASVTSISGTSKVEAGHCYDKATAK